MMRLLCELVVIIGLIALGWQKPFHEWVELGSGKHHAADSHVRKGGKVRAQQPFLMTATATPTAR